MRWTWTRTAQGSAGLAIGSAAIIAAGGSHPDEPAAALQNDYFLIAYNDLGMHCMNEGFSEIAILPPFNTLRAQVFKRGDGEPDIVDENVELFYSIPANTHSAAKTDFWTYAPQLFGVELAAWGPCPGCPADLNGDGVVNSVDLAILLAAWT